MGRKYFETRRNSTWSEEESSDGLDWPTVCPRCQGLFVKEFCQDIHDGTGVGGFWACRCLQCGEVLDPLIARHRISRPQPVLTGRPRQRPPLSLS